jgi:glucarate dehydratase
VIVGMEVFVTAAVAAAIDAALLPTVPGSHERGWIASAVEVACLDAQGRLTGRPVSDLLGGRVRDSVPFAAYLFYKWPNTRRSTAVRRSATAGARPSTRRATSSRPG